MCNIINMHYSQVVCELKTCYGNHLYRRDRTSVVEGGMDICYINPQRLKCFLTELQCEVTYFQVSTHRMGEAEGCVNTCMKAPLDVSDYSTFVCNILSNESQILFIRSTAHWIFVLHKKYGNVLSAARLEIPVARKSSNNILGKYYSPLYWRFRCSVSPAYSPPVKTIRLNQVCILISWDAFHFPWKSGCKKK